MSTLLVLTPIIFILGILTGYFFRRFLKKEAIIENAVGHNKTAVLGFSAQKKVKMTVSALGEIQFWTLNDQPYVRYLGNTTALESKPKTKLGDVYILSDSSGDNDDRDDAPINQLDSGCPKYILIIVDGEPVWVVNPDCP